MNHQVRAALRPMILAISPVFIAPIIGNLIESPERMFRLGFLTSKVGPPDDAAGLVLGGGVLVMTMMVGPGVLTLPAVVGVLVVCAPVAGVVDTSPFCEADTTVNVILASPNVLPSGPNAAAAMKCPCTPAAVQACRAVKLVWPMAGAVCGPICVWSPIKQPLRTPRLL